MDVRDYGDGWLATGANSQTPARLWRTVDGGKTWTAALSLQGTTGDLERVHFFDLRRGYALVLTPAFDLNANTLMVTSDAGQAWDWFDFPKPQGMVLADFYLSPRGDGRALFSAGANGDFGRLAAALYTTNDGISWSLAARVDAEHSGSSGLSLDGSKGPMLFTDAAHGIIVSQLDARSLGAYSTADGGSTWTLHVLPPFSSGYETIGPADVHIALVDGELLLGVVFLGASVPRGAIVYRSLDGGLSWSQPIEVPTSDGVAAPVFAGSSVWWIPDARAVEVTTDGGGTWIRADLHLPPSTRVKAVYPIDDRRAWVFAGDSFGAPTLLYETTDGGETWSVRKPPA
jgi:photosystem II stability/assembly factor-like uncharacterized protein